MKLLKLSVYCVLAVNLWHLGARAEGLRCEAVFTSSPGEKWPTYLDEMNEKPEDGIYADLIQKYRAQGKEPNPIWFLYAYRTEIGDTLGRTAQPIIRGGNSNLSPGLRELIGTYVSAINNVEFCWKIHGGAAATLLGDKNPVAEVLKDPETSSLPEKEKVLFRYARKLTLDVQKIGPEDITTLKNAGWTDVDVYYLVSTVSMFNYFNRWVMATGVRPPSDAVMEQFGKGLAANGYAKSKTSQ